MALNEDCRNEGSTRSGFCVYQRSPALNCKPPAARRPAVCNPARGRFPLIGGGRLLVVLSVLGQLLIDDALDVLRRLRSNHFPSINEEGRGAAHVEFVALVQVLLDLGAELVL